CFRLGDFDAQKLADGFTYFDSKDLRNLGTGEAIVRMERAEYDFNLRTMPLAAIDPQTARLKREFVIEKSRLRYASRRADIEASLYANEPTLREKEIQFKGEI